MSKADNLAAVAIVGPIAQTGDWDRLDEVIAPDIVVHHRAEGQPPGLDGIKWYWQSFSAAFPGWKAEPIVLFGDEEYVTFVASLSGTHTGEFLGHAPTGRKFSIDMVQVLRFSNGYMVEQWGGPEMVGVLRKLGLGDGR